MSESVPIELGHGGLREFDVQGEPQSLAQRWKLWKRSFNLFVVGKGVKEEKQKTALLLHTAGPAVQEIFYTLVGEEEDKTYKDTVKVLDDYFTPQTNIPFERHVFRQLSQSSTETVDQYVCRLRQRSATCDFGTKEEEHIRDQLIDKCHSSKLRRKFLELDGTVTLQQLLKVARAQEAVDRQMEVMGDDKLTTAVAAANQANEIQEVNAAREENDHRRGTANQGVYTGRGRRNTNSQTRKECYNCGGLGHFARDDLCPARGRLCNQCGRMGHFKARCRMPATVRHQYEEGRRGKLTTNTNLVDWNKDCDQGSNRDFAFSVSDQRQHKTKGNGLIKLEIGGVSVKDILIDSGATCNIMGKETWEWLKSCKVKCNSRKCSKELYAYGSSDPLPVLGTFTAEVYCQANNQSCMTEFVVVDGPGRTLLCKGTAETLEILRVGPYHVNNVGELPANIMEKYDKLCEGIGMLKDYKLKLNIDETVPPVAQKIRRIPFGLRDKVNEKLDELLENDIIEEVPEGPTSWVSPLVVIPKQNGDIRICVDMRKANEAIIRERQPIPTVEELLQDLNGSTVFSKLDLKWGFHQIVLDETSRYVTTFVTHRGLYRYKRLMFGVSSAPEKYQQIIQGVIRKCEGVANIADDLIIHGSGKREHDERLLAVLERLDEAGLTLNAGKCEFRLNKLEFFWT